MNGKSALRNLGEVLRDEMVERDRIATLLHDGPKTIPEIAAELGAPTHEVTKWIMAMRRFGRIRELPKSRADDYYRYQVVEEVR
jgi:predicted Rossmann fold nucleotide-binding protein DprA/Smf involved in DNA uptake